jgi:hypothetical protein
MASRRYEHLIKPLAMGAVDREDVKAQRQPWVLAAGPGNASRQIRLNGRNHLEGLNLNFAWGIHTGLGDWHAGLDPHVHPYTRCLMFVGLDTANVNYLGAEIRCCLGAEQEAYTFNEPTAIVVPAGLPHGPITTHRMYSPKGFGFWAVELHAVSEITWLGKGVSSLSAEHRKTAPEDMKFAAADKILRNKPIQPTGKYAHLVKSLRSGLLIERGKLNPSRLKPDQPSRQEKEGRETGQKPGPGNPDHLTWMRGEDLEGMNVNIFWGFCSRPGIWRRGVGSLVHPVDEVLVYVGTDPNNMDYLGAEIEMDMGEEHERYFIRKPAALVCSAGMPRNPQITRWVDKPFAFFAVSLSGEHGAETFA